MKLRLLAPALFLALATTVTASDNLVARGSGLRTKPILGVMYEITLLVPESLREAGAAAIIAADLPMEFVLVIQSGLITRARFVEATSEGFVKAAKSGHATDKTQPFLDQFAGVEFKKGDIIAMRFAEGQLQTAYRTEADEKPLGSIPGLDLKQALFAIWLGDRPVQESLKQGLLGMR